MFGEKKYNPDNFVIIRKEKVLEQEKYRPRPYLPWSTFNYSIRTSLDGAENYSLAYKINNTYLDLFDLNTYSEFDAFKCSIGDEVITEKKKLVENATKLTCSDAIDLFVQTEEAQLNSIKNMDEKELLNIKRNVMRVIKKLNK